MVVEKKEAEEVEEFKMEINVIEKIDKKLVLELSNTNETEVNTLRRLIVSEVPTMAIEEVEFIKNDTALFDEILANRLGLIPLTTDLKIYKEGDDDKKGKVLNQVEFKLKAKGPVIVYSKELESTDEKIKSVFEDIPIVKLLEGQELELHAIAVLGRGKQHMKFSPGVVYYHHKPILVINNDAKKIEQFKDEFPKQAFKDGKLNEEALLKDNLYEACEGACEELLKVDYEEDKFIVYIESFGQLDCVEMIITALEKLNDKIEEFEKALKGNNLTEKVIKDAVNVAKKVTKLKK
ncbi:DNA-directed RNA polymerase subunit D [archaeon]|nr:DNA-directed RNA polymerase subunit D [archaeon]